MTFQVLVVLFLPIVQKPGLKKDAHVHLLDEVYDFIIVHYSDYIVNTLNMTLIKMAGKGGDV